MRQDPNLLQDAASHIPELLPPQGRVVAVVIGIGNYQGGRFSTVPFAEDDAREFARLLGEMYGNDRIDCELFINEHATKTSLDYQIPQAIKSACASDLFVFFYAGHGFFGAGDNYLTAFDTGTGNVIESSLPVLEALVKPLADSDCRRALLFIDACATQVPGRALISEFDATTVGLPTGGSDDYHALFLSCQRGQSSYPSAALRHGVWTFHLLAALRGVEPDAIAPGNVVTDVSLRDYLREAVPRYIRENLKVRGRQTPEALIRASSTFVIRALPEAHAIIEGSDLSMLAAPSRDVYFEGTEEGSVKRLPGFNKKAHHAPWDQSRAASQFVRMAAWPRVRDDIAAVYRDAKSLFGLRRDHLATEQSENDASGSLDCEYFRYSIEAEQNPDDNEEYRIVRQLVLRDTDDEVVQRCQQIFGARVDRLIIEVDQSKWDFDELVARFEDLREGIGGKLEEDENTSVIRYSAPDDVTLEVDVANGRIMFSAGDNSIPQLLERARAVTFGLSGGNQLALR